MKKKYKNNNTVDCTLFDGLSWSQRKDESDDLAMVSIRMEKLRELIRMHESALKQYYYTCDEMNITPDASAIVASEKISETVQALLEEHNSIIQKPKEFFSNHQDLMYKLDQIYRVLLNLQVSHARIFSWSAQSYAATKIPQFFDGARTKKEGVNYDRVQSPRVGFIEAQLTEVYGFNSDNVETLCVSSGTAAYNILEKYLLIHVLQPGDKILVAPTMYDEHQDWAFRDIPHVEVITKDVNQTDDILRFIHEIKPKVVMIDSLKNRLDTRMTDVAAILNRLRDEWHEDIYILIDDTMSPGVLDPFKACEGNEHIKPLLCSSGSKYLQIGQDVSISGNVSYPKEMSKRMKNIRMFHGTVMNDVAAWSYPNFDREFYHKRMKRLTRNALFVSDMISECKELGEYFRPIYAGRSDHPDFETASKLPFLGGAVNLFLLPRVENPIDNLHDVLDEMIVEVLEQARLDGNSLAWGETVGSPIPRIAVHLEWLWRLPPYLRFFVGDRTLDETSRTAKSVIKGLVSYMTKNKDKFIFDHDVNTIQGQGNLIEVITENHNREELGFFN